MNQNVKCQIISYSQRKRNKKRNSYTQRHRTSYQTIWSIETRNPENKRIVHFNLFALLVCLFSQKEEEEEKEIKNNHTQSHIRNHYDFERCVASFRLFPILFMNKSSQKPQSPFTSSDSIH